VGIASGGENGKRSEATTTACRQKPGRKEFMKNNTRIRKKKKVKGNRTRTKNSRSKKDGDSDTTSSAVIKIVVAGGIGPLLRKGKTWKK